MSWTASIAVMLLAFAMRLVRLGQPRELAFDETYYAKDAWSLVHHGYVREYVENANQMIERGDLSGLWKADPSMIVHPEVGKWLIGLGELAFGMDPVGWRVPSVVVGSLMVLVMVRLVRRLTGSTMLGCVAGLLLALDGLHFVLSRMALLDIFTAFFTLCAVHCLVVDRRAAPRPDGAPRRRAGRPGLGAGARTAVAAVARGVGRDVRSRRRHQVDRALPARRVRRPGLALERGGEAQLRRPPAGAPLGARRRRPGVRPPGGGRRPRLHRHLDRVAGARRRVRAGALRDAVHPLRELGGPVRRRVDGGGEVGRRAVADGAANRTPPARARSCSHCGRSGTTTRTSTPSTPTSSAARTTPTSRCRRGGCC